MWSEACSTCHRDDVCDNGFLEAVEAIHALSGAKTWKYHHILCASNRTWLESLEYNATFNPVAFTASVSLELSLDERRRSKGRRKLERLNNTDLGNTAILDTLPTSVTTSIIDDCTLVFIALSHRLTGRLGSNRRFSDDLAVTHGIQSKIFVPEKTSEARLLKKPSSMIVATVRSMLRGVGS